MDSLEQARAALRALREPDEAMLEAGWDATPVGWLGKPDEDLRPVWEAMIDAILAEPTGER